MKGARDRYCRTVCTVVMVGTVGLVSGVLAQEELAPPQLVPVSAPKPVSEALTPQEQAAQRQLVPVSSSTPLAGDVPTEQRVEGKTATTEEDLTRVPTLGPTQGLMTLSGQGSDPAIVSGQAGQAAQTGQDIQPVSTGRALVPLEDTELLPSQVTEQAGDQASEQLLEQGPGELSESMSESLSAQTASSATPESAPSPALAGEQASPSVTVSERTKDFLSDPARTGSLLGTIIAGAAVPNPLAPLLGSVVGFLIGKRSAYSEDQEEGGRRTLANRSFVPEAGVEVPSIAGLATGSAIADTADRAPLVPPSPGAVDADALALGNTGTAVAPAIRLSGEPAIGQAMPASSFSIPGSAAMPDPALDEGDGAEPAIARLVPPEEEAAVLPRKIIIRDPGIADEAGTAPDSPLHPAQPPRPFANGSSSVPSAPTLVAGEQHDQQVIVQVEPPEEIDPDTPRVTNHPEQMVKTTYDPAGVEAIKRLRRQLAESCSKGNHEKPTTSRCYYLAQ